MQKPRHPRGQNSNIFTQACKSRFQRNLAIFFRIFRARTRPHAPLEVGSCAPTRGAQLARVPHAPVVFFLQLPARSRRLWFFGHNFFIRTPFCLPFEATASSFRPLPNNSLKPLKSSHFQTTQAHFSMKLILSTRVHNSFISQRKLLKFQRNDPLDMGNKSPLSDSPNFYPNSWM